MTDIYGNIPSDRSDFETEVVALVAICNSLDDNIGHVFVKTDGRNEVDIIRVGFFLTLFRPVHWRRRRPKARTTTSFWTTQYGGKVEFLEAIKVWAIKTIF